ncbi:hypothetical protein KA001_00910 [Patescibacteria group bacterium]|nr:hypothetical protein [Patescibacteria group bacterium]
MKPNKLTNTGKPSTFYPDRLIYEGEDGILHDLFPPEDPRSTIKGGSQTELIPFLDLMGTLYWMQRTTQTTPTVQ